MNSPIFLYPRVIIATVLCLGFSTLGADNSTETAVAGMSLEELIAAKIKLDETFDIFDGVVKKQHNEVASGGSSQAEVYAPAVTSVITARDIEAMGAATLADVLRAVPGLYIGFGDAGNYSNNYTMRGVRSISGAHIVLMLNSIPATELFSGSPRALTVNGSIPIHNIARIEIIRGPGSVLYGADATGGVINIITKTAANASGTETGLRVESFDTLELWARHGDIYHDLEIAGALQYRGTDGHGSLIEADQQTFYDNRDGTDISLAPGSVNTFSRILQGTVDIANVHCATCPYWHLHGMYYLNRHAPGSGVRGNLTPDDGRVDVSLGLIHLRYHHPSISRYWDLKADLSLKHFRFDDTQPRTLFLPGALGNRMPHGYQVDARFQEFAPRLEFNAFYSGLRNHQWLLGGGYAQNDLYEIRQFTTVGTHPATDQPITAADGLVNISDSAYIPVKEGIRENLWAVIQDNWLFAEDWRLTAGLRYDDFSDFGKVLTPRLSLLWEAAPEFHTKLLYGEAFLAPGYTFMTNQMPTMQGNPDLEATTLNSLELVFQHRVRANFDWSLNLFKQKTEGIIERVWNRKYSYYNSGKLKGHGLELEARWKPGFRHGIIANYAWQHGKDENRDQTLTAVPEHKVYLRHDWLWRPRWYLNTQLYWAGAFKRARNDPRDVPDAQFSLDVTLRYKQPPPYHWTFAVGVRNLSDHDNRDPSPGPAGNGVINFPYDYPLGGRLWFGEVRYHF